MKACTLNKKKKLEAEIARQLSNPIVTMQAPLHHKRQQDSSVVQYLQQSNVDWMEAYLEKDDTSVCSDVCQSEKNFQTRYLVDFWDQDKQEIQFFPRRKSV